MKKLFCAVLLSLLLAQIASAGPIDWIKHHKRFLAMEGAATGSALVGAYGLKHCRDAGVEKCTGHYGAAWGIYGFGVGLNFAMTAVAEGCWSDSNGSGNYCNIFAYGGSATQTAWGIHEWYLGGGKHEHEKEKPDLRNVSFIRH